MPDTVDFNISVFLCVHGFYYRTQRTVEVIEVVELTEVGGFFYLNHELPTMDFLIRTEVESNRRGELRSRSVDSII